ncbi:methyl-accepting chemotaxis protein [Melittangium boletus]|uniref:methyl-accepting chemotaxis protein n=1 Tax=Melittangium boletus TaxID=83453 RepID=UPI003DA3AD38
MSDPGVSASSIQAEIKRLSWRIFWTYQLYSLTAAIPLMYVVGLTMGLSPEQQKYASGTLQPPFMVLAGILGPFAIAYFITRGALTPVRGEPESVRLVRLLKAPRRMELALLGLVTLGNALYMTTCCIVLKSSPWTIVWGGIVNSSITALVLIQFRLTVEQLLRPHALALFQANPTQSIQGSGIAWLRQSWFLPYAFGLFVFTTLALTATILSTQVIAVFSELSHDYAKNQADFGQMLMKGAGLVLERTLFPMVGLGAYLLLNAAIAALRLARHQTEGASAVGASIQALANGKAQLPAWVTTDEMGDLSRATAQVFTRLGNLSLSLADSARQLGHSAEEMGASNLKQNEILTRQAAAIQETQVTSQEIKQTSLVASQKAEAVLKQTEKADEISRSGEAAVEQSLSGLQAIRDSVKQMENHIRALDDRAKQIGKITTTVKDLADQSNMLALNAAIEAVRSGEHGKGFAVVAREIRILADQSIKATNSVRDILLDISSAIRTTVSITEQGTTRVEDSLKQVRASGENIRQLSVIVRENAQSVRHISMAVTQQNAGIGQIFQAINDLSELMAETMTRLRASDEAMELVRTVAHNVSGYVSNYGWNQIQGDAKNTSSPRTGSPESSARLNDRN